MNEIVVWLSVMVLAVSSIGLTRGLVLLRRQDARRRERNRRRENGVLKLLITKRIVRYTLISAAMLDLVMVALLILFTDPPRWHVTLLLVLLPIILSAYLEYDFHTEGTVEEKIREGGH